VNINGLVFQWFRLPKQPKKVGSLAAWRLKRKFPADCLVFTADESYGLYDLGDLMQVIKLDRFKELKYEKERRDCDDYTWALMGLVKSILPGAAFGLLWMDVLKEDGSLDYKHSCCCCVSPDGSLYYVEPQTGTLFSPDKKKYKPYMVVI